MGGDHLARGVRRAGRRPRPRPASSPRRRRASSCPPARSWSGSGWSGPRSSSTAPRSRSSSSSPRMLERRAGLVPALLRARRRLGPGRADAPGPSGTATSGSSTGRRSGRRARTSATGACCSPARTGTCRSTRASPASCVDMRRPASRCGRCARSPGTRTSTRCSSPTCASRSRTWSGGSQRRLGRRADHARQRAADDRWWQVRHRIQVPLAGSRGGAGGPTTRSCARSSPARTPASRCLLARSTGEGTRQGGSAARTRGVGDEAGRVPAGRRRRRPRARARGCGRDAHRHRRRRRRDVPAAVPQPVVASASAGAPSRSSATSSASACSGSPASPTRQDAPLPRPATELTLRPAAVAAVRGRRTRSRRSRTGRDARSSRARTGPSPPALERGPAHVVDHAERRPPGDGRDR